MVIWKVDEQVWDQPLPLSQMVKVPALMKGSCRNIGAEKTVRFRIDIDASFVAQRPYFRLYFVVSYSPRIEWQCSTHQNFSVSIKRLATHQLAEKQ